MRDGFNVLLDLDGVLVDFTGGICRMHGASNPYEDRRNGGVYAIETLLGLPQSEFWCPANNDDFWANLEWAEDGQDILSAAEGAVGVGNVYLLTSPTMCAESLSGKYRWVAKNMPAYRRRLMVGPSKHLCASPRNILIDDSDANVEAFRAAGGRAILVPRPWNSLHAEYYDAMDCGLSVVDSVDGDLWACTE